MPEEVNQSENENQVIPSENVGKVLAIEFLLFALTLGLGIVTAVQAYQEVEEMDVSIPEIHLGQFLFYFVTTTVFILLMINLLKFRKEKSIIFKLFFVAAVFLGGWVTVSIWIPNVTSVLLMGFLIVWWWKKPSVLIQDICVVLAIAGTGSLLGLSFQPEMVVALLAIFSVYDVIAVYKTKHMVKLAKEMIRSKAVLGLIIPQNVIGFGDRLENLKPGGKLLVLGGGDMVFPLLLCTSLVPSNELIYPVIVGLFSLLGLSLSFYFFLSQEKREPIPALPPIALCSIIGFLLTRFL